MPRQQPVVSWTQLRNLCEKFSYIHESGVRITTFNPPKDAKGVERVPFFLKAISGKGEILTGNVVSLRVNVRKRQRLCMWVESKQCRWIRDYLIMEVDGVRVVTH